MIFERLLQFCIGENGVCAFRKIFDFRSEWRQFVANSAELFKATRESHACVDLIRANRAQLAGAGVNDEQIYTAPLCTMCRTDLFFSYRREKSVYGKVGRLMSVIGTQG